MKKTKSTFIFKLITFSIPFVFFIGLEFALKILGYGIDLPLFIDTPDSKNYSLARPDIIKRYFPNTNNIPSVTMEANLFLKEKPKNGLRIFVQGGSTAAGFPYGFGASPAGLLDQRLSRTFPNRTVEVINTAMSAVNSYTLLDFVDEIIEQKPDAVLIYTGHNEYLGILGVGSNYTATNSHAANLMFLKLRGFKTFQLMQNTYALFVAEDSEALTDIDSEQHLKNKRTMMAKVAKNKSIDKRSDVFLEGLDQFEYNIGIILSKYQKAKIPVLISTVASNHKDQPPFSSVKTKSNDLLQLNRIFNEIQSGEKFSKYQHEISRLLVLALKDWNAEIFYKLAKIYELGGKTKEAKSYYVEAKERDLLRFRAPEGINDIIRDQAKKYGAILVNYKNNLTRGSPNGLIGNNFMLEHLHPNLQGYFILADSFYQKLKAEKLFGDWKNSVATSQAWKERPIIAAEEYAGFAKIIRLKSDYPYTKTPKEVVLPKPSDWQQEIGLKYYSKEINWLQMLNLSYKGYLERRNLPMVLKTSEMIADAIPFNTKVNFRVAKQQLQAGNKLAAKRFFQRAVLEEPTNKKYKTALSTINN
ncbi:MAG: hypothetical protein COA86_16740 [Kangiella sp.]|nr:MAG: hypothetical protein COA86_16740 [Kangiella sp.]